jgi:hypothetical protein
MRLMRISTAAVLLLGLVLPLAAAPQASNIPTPSQFLGFQVGADRKLADYHQITSYFKELASKSDKIEVETIGKTTLGNDFIMAVISSPENLKNKKKYQEIAHKLADPRGLTQPQIDALVNEGKTILLVDCNIHSTEIASSQMSMELAHSLITSDDPAIKERLDKVILLLIPSMNPDGEIMETEWYRKNLGTQYEGSRMPWLYHPYVGHDDNRDWYMLTQKETKAVTHMVYYEWFPQIWLDEHQMGSDGPRLFVPPYTDPIADSVDPLMWRGINVIGQTMAWRLEEKGKSGVVYDYIYDQYWPGATEGTPQFKNIFGLLTEAASAKLATPIFIPPSELRAGGKGLIDYRRTANFPDPWPGGWWRLRDIMDYEFIATNAILEVAAYHNRDFMQGTATMAQHQIEAGNPNVFWRIPREQYDSGAAAKLAYLLREHAIEVMVSADGKDFLVPTAQPYGKFANELLGTQRYPLVRVAQGQPPLRPYDVTAWSLPLLMGVDVDKVTLAQTAGMRQLGDNDWPKGEVSGSGPVYALSHNENDSIKFVNEVLHNKGSVSIAQARFNAGNANYPAGTFLVDKSDGLGALAQKYHVTLEALAQRPTVRQAQMRESRVALYKPWLASMDEGWTRWLLEQYGFNMKNVDNKAIKAGNLNAAYDVIILPDVSRDVIVDGKPKPREGGMKYFEELPPEYQGGIGKEGVTALKEFVRNGGTLITFESAGELVIDEFNLPVANGISRGSDVNVPGSLLRLDLNTDNPIAYGLPEQVSAFVAEPIVYRTGIPMVTEHRSVLATYPADAEDVLKSGYLKGGDSLTHQAAAVEFGVGKGDIVMFGFGVQHRAQTEGTFKLLFNAIQQAAWQPTGERTAVGQ